MASLPLISRCGGGLGRAAAGCSHVGKMSGLKSPKVKLSASHSGILHRKPLPGWRPAGVRLEMEVEGSMLGRFRTGEGVEESVYAADSGG